MKSTLVAQPETFSLPRPRGLGGGDSDVAKNIRSEVSDTSATARVSSIVLVGTSFKTSSLAFREALAGRLSRESAKLSRLQGAKEYAQLVTCNRIEILIAVDSTKAAEKALVAWVSKTPGMKTDSLYIRKDVEAIAHLFRVASGLDSMVLGEEQILSQVRDAGIAARTSRSSRGSLSALFDASVNVGKRARTTFKQADDSVSSMALRFALGRLPRAPRSVLLIGTGKTTRLAANQLDGARLYVATRRASLPSFSRATLVAHKDLRGVAARCDLVISATKHRGYLLKRGDLDGKRRVILDLAFPRNVDPALNEGQTEVYNLEDLAEAFASRRQSPGPDARRAEELVFAEAESFSRWLLASRQSSALSRVYLWAESTRRDETDAALRRLPRLTERERSVVEAMSKRLVSKLLAPPTSFVKSSSPELPQDQRLDVVQRIFEQGGK
ncbi:MAG TPA: glutamyl-tRNA reductase [Nitrososphaerales archaeon]|nr:glutamyl-tRNA reductase [Nitrososphaerales archaeon]